MRNMVEINRGTSESSNCREKKLPKIIMVALVVAILFAASLSLLPELLPTPARAAYTAHDPIYINGDAGFLGPNASTGISWGSGTASDPYIIEGWDINASSSDGIDIRNSNVHFTVRDCYLHNGSGSNNGIYLDNCVNGVLERNTCSNTYNGIYLHNSDGNTLSNNNCSNNEYEGIDIDDSSSNTLWNNTCSSNDDAGIYLWYSSNNNILSNNTCSSNNLSGIFVDDSRSNILSNNTCSSNNFSGICLRYSNSSTLSNNICSSNNFSGIFVDDSSNNTLSNNECSSNEGDGIYLSFSSNNTLSNNECSSNDAYGMRLCSGGNNTLSNNTCSSNEVDGMRLFSSADNTLSQNQLRDNVEYGVHIDSQFSPGSGNRIWNNTFINNNGVGVQAYDEGTNNWWNSSGTPHGYGNYWDDWTTPDSVEPWGIVDNPYDIEGTAGKKDWYPLTTPFSPPIPEFSEIIVPIAGLMLIALVLGRARKKP